MKLLITLLVFAGCDTARNNNNGDQGMLEFGDLNGVEDLAVFTGDLAGADLAGLDLRNLDLATGSDLAMTANSDLTVPPPDGMGTITPAESCGTAPTLTAGLLYGNLDTTGMTDDYHIGALSNGTCNTNNNVYKGPDAAFTIMVPNGKTLVVQVQPSGGWDPSIAIVEDCSNGATCLSGHDDTNQIGDPESASWTNATGAVKTVYVIVDSYYQTVNNNHGQYSLLAALQ